MQCATKRLKSLYMNGHTNENFLVPQKLLKPALLFYTDPKKSDATTVCSTAMSYRLTFSTQTSTFTAGLMVEISFISYFAESQVAVFTSVNNAGEL